jgi:hypothetical protein
MDLDLSAFNTHEYKNCLTARDLTRHADLYAAAFMATDNRALVGHLLEFAEDLMTASQTLTDLFLTDGHDPSRDTQEGLTEVQRLQVLTLASTCAYNATLFLQEAQRRRVKRVHAGWDPITSPVTA